MSHAAAEKAELTGQVRSFLAGIGDGRKLTQTGRIGLADARHLVESLGTGDKFDQEIGDRVFKTKSSEELVNDRRYGPSDPEGEYVVGDETQFRLGDLVKAGDRIGYAYDFGDGWDHELAIEAATEAESDGVYPACAGGEGACPPEDSGGAPGFADLKALLAGPPSPERDEIREWAGDYDPARFNLTTANAAVAAI